MQKGRLCFRGRPYRSDAWLSCTGPGELAPEVGKSEPVNIIHGRSVPPPVSCPGSSKDRCFRPVTPRGHVLLGHVSGDAIASIVKQRRWSNQNSSGADLSAVFGAPTGARNGVQ